MARRTSDFPHEILVIARDNPTVYQCISMYMREAVTEYEALTKMVILLAEENSRLQKMLVEEVQNRPPSVDRRLLSK